MKLSKQVALLFALLTCFVCASSYAAYYPYIKTQITIHNYSAYPAEVELVQMGQRFIVPGDTDYTAVAVDYFGVVDVNVRHPISHRIFATGYISNYGVLDIEEDTDFLDDFGIYYGVKGITAKSKSNQDYKLKVTFQQAKQA